MLMVSGNLRIGLLTDHIPISKIAESITKEVIENKINTIHKTLVEDFKISKPKIAILGINPHSGDDGVIGSEEKTVLSPTIQQMRENNMLVFGPYSADSFFGSGQQESFDAVIAAYHDQGLIPFKTLSFGQGVNYTAGLEKIRTSPDHGTAYSIAGKGIADETSFKEAIFLAILIYRNRTEHQELIKGAIKEENPTKTK
jgi:4-hydroxythreonine-4-phosphate dehydrogenase